MPSYKLTYFDIRGLAENARIFFAVAKQPYEDVRLTLAFGTPGDFSTIKRPEFDEMKAKGELDTSLGKVPLLEVDGAPVQISHVSLLAVHRCAAAASCFMRARACVRACVGGCV